MSTPHRFLPVAGLLLEAVGDDWVAFSPLSGDTMVLNDQSAAVLEVLLDGAGDSDAVCTALATDTGLSVNELADRIQEHLAQLVDCGLVVTLP